MQVSLHTDFFINNNNPTVIHFTQVDPEMREPQAKKRRKVIYFELVSHVILQFFGFVFRQEKKV